MNEKEQANNKLLKQETSLTDIREFLKEHSMVDFAPEKILLDVRAAKEKTKNAKNKKEREIAEKEENAQFQKTIPLLNFEKHYLPVHITNNQHHQTFIIDFSNQLIEEYKCQTPSEKSLVHMVAISYVRVLDYSQKLYAASHQGHCSHDLNGFCGMLSKELDRANRQYTSALMLLKQAKSPNIKVNIKSENTLIAQNQQLNINGGNGNQHENINP